MKTEPDDENPMEAVQELAAEMAQRHRAHDTEALARFVEECRALGIDPAKQRVTPLVYALAVAGAVQPRNPKK
ncbi:hypothetical protein [Indioceanicola profundi]|uniref:hypothetical protein n=1 Tax=Indioceanicola profundi TaxID=2220096 RepID=UPI000E6AB273|nr:hypothetical protein [Indioceanicola profundi]